MIIFLILTIKTIVSEFVLHYLLTIQIIFVWFPCIYKLEARSLSQSQTPARIPGKIPACLAWCLEPGPRPLPRTADWLRHSAVPTVSEDNTSVRLQGTQVEVTRAGWLPPPPHLYPVSQVVPELQSKSNAVSDIAICGILSNWYSENNAKESTLTFNQRQQS